MCHAVCVVGVGVGVRGCVFVCFCVLACLINDDVGERKLKVAASQIIRIKKDGELNIQSFLSATPVTVFCRKSRLLFFCSTSLCEMYAVASDVRLFRRSTSCMEFRCLLNFYNLCTSRGRFLVSGERDLIVVLMLAESSKVELHSPFVCGPLHRTQLLCSLPTGLYSFSTWWASCSRSSCGISSCCAFFYLGLPDEPHVSTQIRKLLSNVHLQILADCLTRVASNQQSNWWFVALLGSFYQYEVLLQIISLLQLKFGSGCYHIVQIVFKNHSKRSSFHWFAFILDSKIGDAQMQGEGQRKKAIGYNWLQLGVTFSQVVWLIGC